MFWNDYKTQQKYYKFLTKFFKFKGEMKILKVDFSKPWWDILLQQKKYVLINLLNIIIFSVTISVAPLILAQIFISENITYLFSFIFTLIILRFISLFLFRYDPILRIQTSKSIENSAANFFMTVDPIFHTTRSTGTIVSKVSRGVGSYEMILDLLSFDLLSLFGIIIGVVIAFGQVSANYAILVAFLLVFTMFVNIFLFVTRSIMFRRFRIKSEDRAKAASLETLQQTQYIRAVFGTKEQLERVELLQTKSMLDSALMWRLGGYIVTITQGLFLSGLGLMSYLLLTNSNLDKTIAISLILSFYQVGNRINFVGNNFGRLIAGLEDVRDLFEFIRKFGKQTYPVLDNHKS